MARAVFLDRDGVLNRVIFRHGRACPPESVDELQILPGVTRACASLRRAGFALIVVTNQPDVARGSVQKETVERINSELRERLPLDDVRVCFHDDCDNCACRKPAPGLILQAAVDWNINLGASFMVGDRWKDIEAGRRAGCRTILIHDREAREESFSPDHCASSLLEGTGWILDQIQPSREGAE